MSADRRALWLRCFDNVNCGIDEDGLPSAGAHRAPTRMSALITCARL